MQRAFIYESLENLEAESNPYEVFLGYKPTLFLLLQNIFHNRELYMSALITKNNVALSLSKYSERIENGTYIINMLRENTILYAVVK